MRRGIESQLIDAVLLSMLDWQKRADRGRGYKVFGEVFQVAGAISVLSDLNLAAHDAEQASAASAKHARARIAGGGDV